MSSDSAIFGVAVNFLTAVVVTAIVVRLVGPSRWFETSAKTHTNLHIVTSMHKSVPEPVLFGFRLMYAGYAAYITSDFIGVPQRLQYLTNISYMSHLLYFTFTAGAHIIYARSPGAKISAGLAKSVDLWCVVNASFALLVTVVFWKLIGHKDGRYIVDVSTHGGNVVGLVIELCLNRATAVVSDVIYLVILVGLYGIFGVCHAYLSSDEPLYHFLACQEWTALMWVCVMLVGAIGAFFAIYALVRTLKSEAKDDADSEAKAAILAV